MIANTPSFKVKLQGVEQMTGPNSQCQSVTANDDVVWEGRCKMYRQMLYGFAAERSREDYNKMEQAMTAKMEEGFRNEQQAREQAQKEIMAGLKNEENAREMVQIDLQAIKDKTRQLESGSQWRHCWQ